MCGIFGYLGRDEAVPILLQGIKDLEYRGYDSAGMAVFENGVAKVAKAVGPVQNLEVRLASSRLLTSKAKSGIVHSRWATHGGVTEKNAHPHTDCGRNIWLAHNGIIENYKQLKLELEKKGHSFKSETDTEVLAHLIEECKKTANKKDAVIPIEEATRLALKKIQGTYGIIVVDRREPEKLIAARNFSPLVLGVGEGAYYVASDATPILPKTRKVVYLKDGEMAVLTPNERKIFSFSNHLVNRGHEEVDWSVEQAKKGSFPHFMLKEIFEQPNAIENSCRGRIDLKSKNAMLGGLSVVEKELKQAKRIILIGCGTAHYAGMLGKLFIEELARIPVITEVSSEWRYDNPIFMKGDVLIAVSQSGETADTMAAVREAKRKRVLTLGITNVVGSTLARETHAGVYQHIGPEISVAATKSFLSQAVILLQIAIFLGRGKSLPMAQAERVLRPLSVLPELLRETLNTSSAIKKLAEKYKEHNGFLFLGRRYNFPVALEGALKLKEISYVYGEGLATGELKHGPIAMVDRNLPTIFIMPNDSLYEKNFSSLQEVKARGGQVLAIATNGNTEIKKVVKDVIYIPEVPEILTPFLTTMPLQFFAYWSGVVRGYNVDKPRNLAKSVTVE
jgi:glucosamine--fructose-6-phosphate aminotransferase (isomerizing)